MNGMLLVDKPKGWTSFDVVNKIRHTVQNSGLNTSLKKRFPVGHTGTLDPLATGLLVILLGDYTKRATELTKLDKVYEVTMKLGQTSTTGDEEGEKKSVSDVQPSEKEVTDAIDSFQGEIEQIPPIYSAIKIGGQRAYKLARAGKVVKIEPRQVKIYKITNTIYDFPFVKFTAHVSTGTYIRTLTEDIGKLLQTGAYMTDLRRTKVGAFDIIDSIEMDDNSGEKIYESLKSLE